MPWYRTGTISVTNGSTTVTGSGTSWVTNALTGEGLLAPDGRVYEIASITSATQLTLASAYLGPNQTGQTYAILPTHTFAKDLASEVSALVVDYQTSKSDFDAGSFSKGTTAAPGINFGVDGQSNTGFTNETTGEIGISIAGTNRGKITATGLNGAAIGATTAAAGTFTNLTANTTLVVPGATTPAQTAEGSVVWDTDSDLLTVGTGAGRKTMVDTDSTQTLTNKTLTTLTTSSTVTHNGGTANGVAYLNGSKVLTTGSALQFDGTNFNVNGGLSSAASASFYGNTTPASGSSVEITYAGSTGFITSYNRTGSAYTDLSIRAGTNTLFSVNGSEQMRLTSTGLGIGTSSPGAKLEVNGRIQAKSSSDVNLAFVLNNTASGGREWQLIGSATGGLDGGGTFNVRDNTAAANRLTIDSSGNTNLLTNKLTMHGLGSGPVGLQVYNYNWLGAGGALQSYKIAMLPASSMGTYDHIKIEGMFDAGWGGSAKTPFLISASNRGGLVVKYLYGSIGQTAHIDFYTEADGSVSVRAVIDAGSYTSLCLNVTCAALITNYTNPVNGTPTGTLAWSSATTRPNLEYNNVANAPGGAAVRFLNYGALGTGSANAFNHFRQFNAGTSGFTTGWIAAAFGDDTGNRVVIGQGSSRAVIAAHSNNLDAWADLEIHGTNIIFGNNTSTERARIDSSGNLSVGTTSNPGWRTSFSAGASGVTGCSSFSVLEVDDYPVACVNQATSGDNRFVWFLTENAGSAARGSIDYNRAGGLVRYNTTSDYRAKDIIGPVQNVGATIDALKVYEGVMKGATQSRPMLIAHEAQEHAPYAVSGVKDEVNEDGTPKFQQMDVSSLVPLLLAEIQSLRARVAALESD